MRESGAVTKTRGGSRYWYFSMLASNYVSVADTELCMETGSHNRHSNLLETDRYDEGQ
jgi:hypothetical protein